MIGNLDLAMAVWFASVVVSVAYVGWDALQHNPEFAVMKWGWILVTLYTGVLGLCFYLLSSKEPRPGTHEVFVKPMWKQALGSTIHCAAGDATGVIVAAALTALLGYPMWVDMIVEYALGFSFGLFIFQALFMRSMMGGSYLENLRGTFLSELLSMNAMMGGMLFAMAIGMTNDMRAMYPESPHFWFVMSMATVVGVVVALPTNWWLVAKGLKHGMGTDRQRGPGQGVEPVPL
jgi:hypothetical protein